MGNGIASLRLFAGFFFIIAGLLAYYGVAIDISIPIILMIAGGALILVVLAGHRPRGGDIALFVIGLLVLGAAASGPGFMMPSMMPSQTVTYTALKDQVDAERINIKVSANFGSIDILFSSEDDVAYRVDFSRPFSFPIFLRDEFDFSFSNNTRGGTLFLNATSSAGSIRVVVGKGYITDIDASASTGNIELTSLRSEALERVSLSTSTGSVDAQISSDGIKELRIKTNTGSIDLKSDRLAPGGANVPVLISTDTGSINFDAKIPRSAAVKLTASVALGSISHNLEGFTILQSTGNRVEATAGDPAGAEESFEITISTGTGSIDLDAEWSL